MVINTRVPVTWQKGVSLVWSYENCKMIDSHDSFSDLGNKKKWFYYSTDYILRSNDG